ncbi:MAG: cadherin-like domain-containing protein, partial [Rivularia sp. (in: cyanobacteria)]
SEITYKLTDTTDNGNLLLNGNNLALNNTFTQADINNNRLIYNHNGSETISDSFKFEVTDGAGGSIGSDFDITVNPVNDAPVAVNDTVTAEENQAVNITVAQLLDNDRDAENNTLSIASVSNAINGSVVNINNNVVFTPDADFNGAASFEYTLSDGNATDNATVSVTVNPRSILGTSGRDVITGNSGDNLITGSRGSDMLTGGGGDDQFIYTSTRDRADIITDFEVGSDKIVLTQLLSRLNYKGSDAIGDGYVSFGSNSQGDALVQIDVNGDRSCFTPFTLIVMQGVTVENLSANADNNFVF